MKNFLLGKSAGYADGFDDVTLDSLSDGAVGFFYNEDGILKKASDGTEIKKEGMIVLGRPANQGGNVVLPVFKNNFSFVKGEYQESTTFSAKVTVVEPTFLGLYSIIVARKGEGFNKRNKWTAMYNVRAIGMTAEELATELAKMINNNTIGSGAQAEVSGADITITAVVPGVDYAIVPADLLTNATVEYISIGSPAYGDAKYIRDLSERAASDAGFEYTYQEAGYYLYPFHPLNPLAGEPKEDVGYTIFTMRFAEPRDVKTRDEVVNQIVQVAFPTGTEAIDTFETVCKGMAE